MSVSAYAQRPVVADSHRSGDEIHPRPPNGDLRPLEGLRGGGFDCRLSDHKPVIGIQGHVRWLIANSGNHNSAMSIRRDLYQHSVATVPYLL